MYGEPRPGASPPAAGAAADVLALNIHRIAEPGRLRVNEDHAAHLVHPARCGTTLTLIAMPRERRDPVPHRPRSRHRSDHPPALPPPQNQAGRRCGRPARRPAADHRADGPRARPAVRIARPRHRPGLTATLVRFPPGRSPWATGPKAQPIAIGGPPEVPGATADSATAVLQEHLDHDPWMVSMARDALAYPM